MHGAYATLENKTKTLLDDIIKTECENSLKIGNWLAQSQNAALATEIISINRMTNSFITLSGEALYSFKCKEVTADVEETVIKDLDNQPVCYNARAKLEGKAIFIKPRNRIITEFS